MLKNYFEEFKMKRDTSLQKVALEKQLILCQKWKIAFEKRLKLQEELLASLRAKQDPEDKEQIAQIEARIEFLTSDINICTERINIIERAFDDLKVLSERNSVETPEEKPSESEVISAATVSQTDTRTSEDIIFDAYLLLTYKNESAAITKARKNNMFESNSRMRDEKEKELSQKEKDLTDMFNLLSDSAARKDYIKQLDSQELIQRLAREEAARLEVSRQHVMGVLGESFNPDMSSIGAAFYKAHGVKKQKGKDVYSWKAEMYDEPEVLLVEKSEYPGIPESYRKIYAFRYGRFDIAAIFRSDGTPLYEDKTMEIIGVTRVNFKGEEKTDFVLTPLIETHKIKNLSTEELFVLDGLNAEKADLYVPYNRDRITKRRNISGPNSLHTAQARKKHEDIFMRGKNTGIKHQSNHVLVSKEERRKIRPEERSFFADIVFSEYLIQNAVTNNAGYLGSFGYQNGNPTMYYNLPMEQDRIEACFFAKKNEGIVSGLKIPTILGTPQVRSLGTEVLFDQLRLTQSKLVATEKKKESIMSVGNPIHKSKTTVDDGPSLN